MEMKHLPEEQRSGYIDRHKRKRVRSVMMTITNMNLNLTNLFCLN